MSLDLKIKVAFSFLKKMIPVKILYFSQYLPPVNIENHSIYILLQASTVSICLENKN